MHRPSQLEKRLTLVLLEECCLFFFFFSLLLFIAFCPACHFIKQQVFSLRLDI